MDLILFILTIAYLAYNSLQVIAMSNGKRHEPGWLLLFFAAPYDLYSWIRDKF